MATFTKFTTFANDIGLGTHNLNTNSIMILLTNAAPNAADTVVDTTTTPCTVKSTSNASEIAAGNGYTKGGTAIGSSAWSGGKLTGNAVTFTASGGTMATFQYAVIYNNTAGTTATRPVIGWWDKGGTVSLGDGESDKIGKDTSGNNWDSGTPILSIA